MAGGGDVNLSIDDVVCQKLFLHGHKRNPKRISGDRIPRPDKVMVIRHSTSVAVG